MKRIIFIVVFGVATTFATAQTPVGVQEPSYYYKGEKISLTLNKTYVYILAPNLYMYNSSDANFEYCEFING